MTVEIAAGKLGVTAERLTGWEQGVEVPTVGQIRQAAALYKTPVSTFFRKEHPPTERPLPDRRTLPFAGEDADVAFMVELRRAREIREVYLALEPKLARQHHATIPINPNTQVTAAAARLRETLGISLEPEGSPHRTHMSTYRRGSGILRHEACFKGYEDLEACLPDETGLPSRA